MKSTAMDSKKIEKALVEANRRNKELVAENRRLRYTNRHLKSELQFAKDVFLKSVQKASEK